MMGKSALLTSTAFILLILVLVLGIKTIPVFAYDCRSWGEPLYCGEFTSSLREVAEDVKKCMGEYHLDLHLPQIVILKSRSFYCGGTQDLGCTIFPDWIILAGGSLEEVLKTLRHELVHYILWVTGRDNWKC